MEFTSDADEGGFVVPFPELPGCISMDDTLEETYKNAMAAKKVWLEATIEEGVTINESDDVENYSGQLN